MLIRPRDLPPRAKLTADVCIVGAGPVGITMALELAGRGHDVVLLESGGVRETAPARDLNRGIVEPAGAHESLEENRRRQLGGSTSVWGGRCVPFDAVDFEPRPWVEASGWPIRADDVARYYPEALRWCEAGPAEFTATTALPDEPAETLDGYDGDGYRSDELERWSTPVRFGSAYRRRLAASPRVRLVLDATCVEVELDADATAAVGVEVVAAERRFQVRARRVVLASGCLESTRLLLSSRSRRPNGIGNDHDLVGRYYMTHLFGSAADLVGSTRPRGAFARDRHGVYVRRRFSFDADLQCQHELLNTVFFFGRPESSSSGHRDAVFSSIYAAKAVRAAMRDPRSARAGLAADRDNLREHLRVIRSDLPRLAGAAPALVAKRFLSRRRLPILLPDMDAAALPLHFQAEHSPVRESVVRLHPEHDAVGLPRLAVSPAFSDLDVDSVVRAHRLVADRLSATGTGALTWDEPDLRERLTDFVAHANSAAHQFGTTRMSASPRAGVVDADCTVHGVPNLSVISTSVFPTSGHANPTLVLLALALRLTDHLDRALQPAAVTSGGTAATPG